MNQIQKGAVATLLLTVCLLPQTSYAATHSTSVKRLKHAKHKSYTHTRKKTNFNQCTCLSYAKKLTGINTHYGSAAAHPINTHTPRVGSIVLMHSSVSNGHAAAVIATTPTTIKIKETGWYGCNVVSVRTLSKTDPHIRGYYFPQTI